LECASSRARCSHSDDGHPALKYNLPGGQVGVWAARLFGEGAESQLDEDLRRFKSVMEAGEAPAP
jgi:uncharacterized membrane protein